MLYNKQRSIIYESEKSVALHHALNFTREKMVQEQLDSSLIIAMDLREWW